MIELSVRWEAVVNPLDENPNAGGGLRIFADRANPNEPPSISNQMARVRVEVDPMFDGLPLYFRILDVDDPSTDEWPVDANGPDGNDNRPDGTAVPAGGRMVQSVVIVSNGVAVADVELSRQPGNNFRVAVACDAGELGRLTVGGGGAGLIPVPANNEAELPGFAGRLTPMLTVWRRLHVELDSMGAVVGNLVTGQITRVDGVNFEGATSMVSSVNFRTGLGDASANFDTPAPGNGRFENGNLTVGPAQHFTANLWGNGDTRVAVRSNAYFNIGFILTKGTNVLVGRVVSMKQSPARFVVKPTIPPGRFNGGSLDVAGHVFAVNAAGGGIASSSTPAIPRWISCCAMMMIKYCCLACQTQVTCPVRSSPHTSNHLWCRRC